MDLRTSNEGLWTPPSLKLLVGKVQPSNLYLPLLQLLSYSVSHPLLYLQNVINLPCGPVQPSPGDAVLAKCLGQTSKSAHVREERKYLVIKATTTISYVETQPMYHKGTRGDSHRTFTSTPEAPQVSVEPGRHTEGCRPRLEVLNRGRGTRVF